MGNSLIDLGKISKPIDTLIKKIADTTGVLYEPTRIKRKAKAEAEANLIKTRNEIEINEMQQRALQRLLTEETKKQENIEDITEKSFKNINENAKPEDIDEDWLSNFFDKCKNISNEEMQKHWSKLLSDEANQPGSISKKTIETFYMMDKKDAYLYTKLLTYGWNFGNTVTIMIDDIQNEVYKKNGMDFSSLSHLEDMGLIKFETLGGFKKMGFLKQIGIFYYGNLVKIEFNKEADNEIEVGKVLLTNVGQELSTIVTSQMDNEYFEYMKDKLSKKVKLI